LRISASLNSLVFRVVITDNKLSVRVPVTSDCEIGLYTKFRENLSGSSKVEMWYTDTKVSHKLAAFFVSRKESV